MTHTQRTAILLGGMISVSGVCFLANSQTANELRTRFATLFGPGTYARIVWQVESQKYRKPNFDNGGSSKIMALDTKDGVVRQLAGAKSGTHYSAPTFTWDGKRVIWTDNAKFQYVLTDFLDSTKRKVLLNGYEGDGHCYRTSDNKDWVLATQAKDRGTLYRVNIDDTTEKVVLLATTWARVGYAGVTCWASISTNGKYVAGGWPNYGSLGWLNVATSTVTKLSNDNGCWPHIARDTTGDMILCPSADADYHRAIRMVNRNQQEIARPNLLTAGLLGTKTKTYYEALRWTPNRDYVTLYAFYNDAAGNWNTAGYPNPRIINIKTMKAVSINDNPTYPEGNADVFFYTDDTGVSNGPAVTSLAMRMPGTVSMNSKFDVRGRVVDGSRARTHGVFVTVAPGGATKRAFALTFAK